MGMTKNVYFVLLCISLSMGGQSQTPTDETGYYDVVHANISKKVIDWSDIADTTISQWLGYDESNISCTSTREVKAKSKPIDAFFQNDKYLNETEDTFIRLRTDSHFQSRDSNSFNLRLSAQIPFNKCRQQLKLFVEDISLDSNKQEVKQNENTDTNLGIRYFGKVRSGIESRYSLGIRGINPYASARYRLPFQTDNWFIDTRQRFQYSVKDAFEEKTNIYFDRTLDDKSLFRFNVQRGTSTDIDGMDYGFVFQYYLNPKQNTGLSFSQSFFGNTKYKIPNEGESAQSYSGINDYVSSLSYRANIWRKWFYYELNPSVNFHREHDYKANYSIRIFFDFYFGEYNQ